MSDIVQRKPATMREWLEGYTERFVEAIPRSTIDPTRFITAAALEIQGSPALQKCSKVSLFQSLLESARYGLEVGKLLGQSWLIPYNDSQVMPDGSRQKVMTAHFQMGYKGLIALARRSETIKTISAEVVYANDFCEIELGQNRHLTHKIDIRQPRGEAIGYYAIVELTNGGVQFSYLSRGEAEAHRDKYSKAAGQGDSPWASSFDEMALKTVIIRVLKLCPVSVEALEAVGRVEQESRNVTPQAESLPPPPDEGFVVEEEIPVETPTATAAKAKILTQKAIPNKVKADFPAQEASPENEIW